MNTIKRLFEKRNRPKLVTSFFIIFYIVGIAGLSIEKYQELFIRLMPLTLILSFLLMMSLHKSVNLKQIVIFTVIAIMGYGLEVLGVLTGIVFGEYQYGQALGLKLWGTPPLIGLNWLMLIYCVHVMFSGLKMHPALKTITGAGLMVVYDIIMEPVAIRLDMWSWGGGNIPIQNYVAWFAISLFFLGLLHAFRIKFNNKVATPLFFIQMIFFLILNILLVQTA